MPPRTKNPGHSHAQTKHISFTFYSQATSPAPFGYEYFVALPPAYSSSSSKKWPLILFLHGAGESQRGVNESYASVRHGIPKVVLCYDRLMDGVDPPSIDVPRAPRMRRAGTSGDRSAESVSVEVCRLVAEEFVTVTPSLNMDFGYGWNHSVLSALLDEVVQSYNVDLDRIHVTGFSMGGYGTWDLAMHSPNRFASLMPICGGGDTVRATTIAHIPQWIHHGDLDDVIPVKQSELMVEVLRNDSASSDLIKFTRYPDLKHDSWTDAYNNPDIYRWMLAQRRMKCGDEVVVTEENLVRVLPMEG